MNSSTRHHFLPPGPESRALRIAFIGLIIAAFGALLGVIGWAIDLRSLWFGGFAVGLLGWAVGLIGIVYGWVSGGRRAITEGSSATLKLVARFWPWILKGK